MPKIQNIKVISRNPDNYMRETSRDLHKVYRNYDPSLHPMSAAREYKQALNATKLEKVFAKPFIASLTHSEAVSSMSPHPHRISCALTGTVEGELSLWNLQTQKSEWTVQAHSGSVHCITSVPDGKSFLSVGNDKTIKRWGVDGEDNTHKEPIDTWLSSTIITGVSHHYSNDEFVTCGERVLLWDATSKVPKTSYDWGLSEEGHEASLACIKFCPVQKNLFASCDYANNLILYDTRQKEVKKLKMTLRLNALDWNPMESFILTAASEDFNCYTYDIRMMDSQKRIVGIHQGHTSAVIDINYSPTGKEFCTGSYDKSIRIFPCDQNSSRDVYHTKRMFKVTSVLWSRDNRYILSGSTDHNVRLWKARASEKLGIMRQREKAALQYSEELKRKFARHPDIRRISKHVHLPAHLYHAKTELNTMKQSRRNKDERIKKHSKPGSVPFVPAIKKPVVGVQDEDM